MLVRHSQSSSIPLCNDDEIKLWDGYSLLYLEGNEKSHHQDLGRGNVIYKQYYKVLLTQMFCRLARLMCYPLQHHAIHVL